MGMTEQLVNPNADFGLAVLLWQKASSKILSISFLLLCMPVSPVFDLPPFPVKQGLQ